MSTEKITIEVLTLRVEVLEKQVALLMANNHPKPDKNNKKDKKTPKSDHDPPKKKRVSGYILFANDYRPKLKAEQNGLKSTDIMKKIALLWNNLDPKLKNEWNLKAKY